MTTPLPQTAHDAARGLDLSGKVFLITGGYAGLGAATARALLSADATVIIAGRNPTSQAAFVDTLRQEGFDSARIDGEHTLDLGDLASVRAFARSVLDRYDTVDVLLLNAGVMNTPAGRTADGFEVQMGTNVIGHFLLAKLLVPITRRQVWLSSRAHMLTAPPPGDVFSSTDAPRIDLDQIDQVDESSYDGWRRYQQSKLGDILLARQFLREHPHLEGCAVHPGAVRTNLSRHLSLMTILKYIWGSITGRGSKVVGPDQGARTQVLCAVMPSDQLVAGAYYVDCEPAEDAEASRRLDDAKALYDYCDRVTAPLQAQ